jgi:hypothetical protein
MRPVERGNIPFECGKIIEFKEYGDARHYLINRLGDYCSYCESQLSLPAIEHIFPKKLYPAWKKSWDNFLLACTFCNSIKKDKEISLASYLRYFWVSTDNTFRAFRYEKDRAPQIALYLNTFQKQIAQNTLELTGLDREPTHPKLSKKDVRWKERNVAWGKAERARINLQSTPTESMRNQIIDTATSTGFFSVWMTVFADDFDMRQRLITAFKGTSQSCFDANTQPIHRTGGQI